MKVVFITIIIMAFLDLCLECTFQFLPDLRFSRISWLLDTSCILHIELDSHLHEIATNEIQDPVDSVGMTGHVTIP